MEFVRLLLVFLHLLGMGMLVAMIMLQVKAGKDAPVNKGWLHGAALQLLTGVALVGIDPLVDSVKYDHIKIGVKLLVVVAIAAVVAINVNKIPEDRLDKMKERADERKLPYPYLFDETQQIAKDFGAQSTPEVILLDRERKVVYMGAFDDSTDPAGVEKKYLDDAVDALLAGQKPETVETYPQGCRIRYEGARRRRSRNK